MRNAQPPIKIGALLLLAACGMAFVVHLQPEKLRAPAWVAYFSLGLFGSAGACIVAQALRLKRIALWLVCVLLGAMTVILAWIALGSGSRQCTMVSLGTRTAASAIMCRGAFGVGATILAVMFIFAVRSALRSGRAG